VDTVPTPAPEPNLSELFNQMSDRIFSEAKEREQSANVPNFAEWYEDGRNSGWGARRDIGRGLTEAEVAELRRLNREHVKPAANLIAVATDKQSRP